MSMCDECFSFDAARRHQSNGAGADGVSFRKIAKLTKTRTGQRPFNSSYRLLLDIIPNIIAKHNRRYNTNTPYQYTTHGHSLTEHHHWPNSRPYPHITFHNILYLYCMDILDKCDIINIKIYEETPAEIGVSILNFWVTFRCFSFNRNECE